MGILIVDDDAGSLHVLRATLEAEGHRVVAIQNPVEAVERAVTEMPDAILLDIMMPEVSGWELLAELRSREEFQDTPILFISAYSELSNRVKALRAGADDLLGKPFDSDELVARVEALIARRRAMYSGLAGSLSAQPFPELVQGLSQGSTTGTLHFRYDNHTAWVEFVHGNVVDAEKEHLRGREALLALCFIKEAEFRFERKPHQSSVLPAIPVQSALLEAHWVIDELALHSRHLPDERAPLEFSGDIRDLSPELQELEVERIARSLVEPGYKNLYDLKRQVALCPEKVELLVAWMAEEGVVRAVELPEGEKGAFRAAALSLALDEKLSDDCDGLLKEVEGALTCLILGNRDLRVLGLAEVEPGAADWPRPLPKIDFDLIGRLAEAVAERGPEPIEELTARIKDVTFLFKRPRDSGHMICMALTASSKLGAAWMSIRRLANSLPDEADEGAPPSKSTEAPELKIRLDPDLCHQCIELGKETGVLAVGMIDPQASELVAWSSTDRHYSTHEALLGVLVAWCENLLLQGPPLLEVHFSIRSFQILLAPVRGSSSLCVQISTMTTPRGTVEAQLQNAVERLKLNA